MRANRDREPMAVFKPISQCEADSTDLQDGISEGMDLIRALFSAVWTINGSAIADTKETSKLLGYLGLEIAEAVDKKVAETWRRAKP